MKIMDLKVVVVTQYVLFALPTISDAVEVNQGKIVGVESELNSISINRSIKRNQANLLILTIEDKDIEDKEWLYKLIKDVKKAHPLIRIITIARKLKQIPILTKIEDIKGIILVNEEISQLIQAIKKVVAGQNYYSQKVSEAMAKISWPNLTSREIEVLALLNKNKNRKEIARELEISYTTVSVHVRNLNLKLQLS